MYKNKEDYNAYFRNRYHKLKTVKYDNLKNNMKLLSDEIIKRNEEELTQMLVTLYSSVNECILPKYRFEIPKENANFINEDISNPLENLSGSEAK